MKYYDVLGLAPDAGDGDIKAAYRRLAKTFHPDSGTPGDVDRFREIQEAYETLSDPVKRRAYDASGRAGRPPGAPVSWTGGFAEPAPPFREVSRRSRPMEPVVAEIRMTEEEAARGGEVVLDLAHHDACPHCAGTGFGFFGWCSECRGEGSLRFYEPVRFRVPRGAEPGEVVVGRRPSGAPIRAAIRIGRY